MIRRIKRFAKRNLYFRTPRIRNPFSKVRIPFHGIGTVLGAINTTLLVLAGGLNSSISYLLCSLHLNLE